MDTTHINSGHTQLVCQWSQQTRNLQTLQLLFSAAPLYK